MGSIPRCRESICGRESYATTEVAGSWPDKKCRLPTPTAVFYPLADGKIGNNMRVYYIPS